jgi:hypothetical protein
MCASTSTAESALGHAVAHVLELRPEEQVLRVAARRVVAPVANLQAIRERSVRPEPRGAMRQGRPSVVASQAAVPTRHRRAGPLPAATTRDPQSLEKAGRERDCGSTCRRCVTGQRALALLAPGDVRGERLTPRANGAAGRVVMPARGVPALAGRCGSIGDTCTLVFTRVKKGGGQVSDPAEVSRISSRIAPPSPAFPCSSMRSSMRFLPVNTATALG